MNDLVGKKIEHIFMNSDSLRFNTDQGDFTYGVEGDCCSGSYFYDFTGVNKLLGYIVKSIEEIDIEDNGQDHEGHESLSFYGYRFITEDPEFGEVSSVMSFRNDSNGYYGGWLDKVSNREVAPEIFEDHKVD